jgi:nucleoside-diphosphate-sugar epimerase
MKIAVTGSSGFVGSHLVKRLKALNHIVFDIDIKKGIDITDSRQLESVEHFDTLFHLAAKSYVPDSYKDPRSFFHLNIIGTLNALELCRLYKAPMIFISSYPYGSPQYLPIDENHPVAAFNPYAQSKLISEQLCQAYNRDFQTPVIIVRPFNLYGPGQNENFLIPSIINQAKSGKIVLKDPDPKRDFLYIDDFIDLLVKLLNVRNTDCQIFNAGSSKSFSVREIAEIVCRLINKNISIEFTNHKRPNEIPDTVADVSKAKKLLGWQPKISAEEGLGFLIQKLNP